MSAGLCRYLNRVTMELADKGVSDSRYPPSVRDTHRANQEEWYYTPAILQGGANTYAHTVQSESNTSRFVVVYMTSVKLTRVCVCNVSGGVRLRRRRTSV